MAKQRFLTAEIMEQDPYDIARYLVSESVGARVNSDNTTAVIVALNSGVDNSEASPMPGGTQKL